MPKLMVWTWLEWRKKYLFPTIIYSSSFLCFSCNRFWLPLCNNMQLYIHSLHCLSVDWSPGIRRFTVLDLHPFQLHVLFGHDRQWLGYGSGGLGQEPPWTHVYLPGHAGNQRCPPLYCHSAQNASHLLAGPFLVNISCMSHTDVFCSCFVPLWICCSTGHGFWSLCGYLCTTPLCNPTYRLSH